MTDKDNPNNIKRFTPLPDNYDPVVTSGYITMDTVQVPVGICVLDHYAMSFIQRGDTVHDAFRNAALALKEREKYL